MIRMLAGDFDSLDWAGSLERADAWELGPRRWDRSGVRGQSERGRDREGRAQCNRRDTTARNQAPGFRVGAPGRSAHLHQGIFFVCRSSTRYLLVVGGAGAAAGHVSWGLGIGVLGWPLPAEDRHATPVARPAALTGRRWCTLAAASHDYIYATECATCRI